jgi:Flp pilus assembly protein TadB
LGRFLNRTVRVIGLLKKDRRSDAESLIQLHGELDRRLENSGVRQALRWLIGVPVLSFLAFRIYQIAADVGFGLEMGAMLLVGAGVSSFVFVSDYLRVRGLRRRIGEIERSQDASLIDSVSRNPDA